MSLRRTRRRPILSIRTGDGRGYVEMNAVDPEVRVADHRSQAEDRAFAAVVPGLPAAPSGLLQSECCRRGRRLATGVGDVADASRLDRHQGISLLGGEPFACEVAVRLGEAAHIMACR